MCKVLKVNRSTYYKQINHVLSVRETEDQVLKSEVKKIFLESKKRYGAPKIHRILLAKGIRVSIKRVQRKMAIMGLRSVVVRKYRYYTKSAVTEERKNILNQDFTTATVNQKWCTDITYIHSVKDGWTYLASVMDFYSKKIIGWSFSKKMTTELALKAVQNACLNVKDTEGIILHSDLGSQYTSAQFEEYLKSKGIKHSFSRKGCPYDNACIESFHSVLKKEEVNLNRYYDFKEAYSAIFEYIESWYNRTRVHGSLNFRTPDAVHKAALTA